MPTHTEYAILHNYWNADEDNTFTLNKRIHSGQNIEVRAPFMPVELDLDSLPDGESIQFNFPQPVLLAGNLDLTPPLFAGTRLPPTIRFERIDGRLSIPIEFWGVTPPEYALDFLSLEDFSEPYHLFPWQEECLALDDGDADRDDLRIEYMAIGGGTIISGDIGDDSEYMKKEIYDVDDDGIVDVAETVITIDGGTFD
jgi:hypothetical protein